MQFYQRLLVVNRHVIPNSAIQAANKTIHDYTAGKPLGKDPQNNDDISNCTSAQCLLYDGNEVPYSKITAQIVLHI